MRVAQFIDTFSRGGAETVAVELSRALAAAGHEPLLLHFGSEHLAASCRRHDIPQRIVPAYRLYKSTRTLPGFAREFARLLRAEGIEALHSHLFGPVTAGALAARLAGVRSVGTLHDVYSITDKPRRIRLLQLAALLGSRLVTVSRDMERLYRATGYFPRRWLATVYNGVEMAEPDPAAAAAARVELGLPQAARVVLCVGRLVPLKRHEILIRALAEIPRPHPMYLVCAGDGPRLGALRELAANRGVADRVRLLGNRDDVPRLLQLADAFALASVTEGLSCSILEAMAAGVPPLVTDVGGNRELVADGESGLLLAAEPAAFAAQMKRLCAQPEVFARMGRASAERARRMFSFEAMTRAYLRHYGADRAGGAAREQMSL